MTHELHKMSEPVDEDATNLLLLFF